MSQSVYTRANSTIRLGFGAVVGSSMINASYSSIVQNAIFPSDAVGSYSGINGFFCGVALEGRSTYHLSQANLSSIDLSLGLMFYRKK